MIDFHSHLDLYPDPIAVVDECNRRGLYVLSVTTTPSAWSGTVALSSDAKHIRTGLGLHPELAQQRMSELSLFDTLLAQTRYVGEIGLDGSRELRDQWKSQVAVFEHVLGRCEEVGGRIMSIHSRRASEPVIDYLASFPGAGTPILHWFSGSFRDLDRALAVGCWFSIGPAMLAGSKGRDLASRIPRDRVLTESDGPFAQLGGNPMMPWDVERAIEELGRVWSVSYQEADHQVRSNLLKLLAIQP